MPLVAETISNLVFAQYLSALPTAVSANRDNPTAGVPTHNVPETMVGALSSGLVTTLTKMTVMDILGGTAGAGATAAPIPPNFPTAAAEMAAFVASAGWAGQYGTVIANVLITQMFVAVTSNSFIQMNPSPPGMGTGTGVVSIASNPGLAAAALASLQIDLTAAFMATNKFGKDDVAGTLTPEISKVISNLATAYANIVGNVTANVIYTGAVTAGPASGINTGKFI